MKPHLLAERIAEHKRSGKGGITSVCSALPAVLRAAAASAKAHDAVLLIESTSNQVDQFGGYTGLTPAQFIAQTRQLIADCGFPLEKLVFGGDHLGPNAWQHETAAEAMHKAEELLRQYAAAGFQKIHLDCSMSCADDPVPLDDLTVATRAARLCKIAEAAAPNQDIVYIVGTEVPVPGGAQEDIEGITPTSAAAAAKTLAVHQEVFAQEGLSAVWPRVIGLVVQPGVEFDHLQVVDYVSEKARELVALAETFPHAVFEAHSTDYQTRHHLAQLVRDHFAILKVGPALTFAYREALYALNRALLAVYPDAGVDVAAVMEATMLAEPSRWQKYYHGDAQQQALLRVYSLSDRMRYYWPQAAVQAEIAKFHQAFDQADLPYGVLHQYLPQAVEVCHNRGEAFSAANLIEQHIRFALEPYYSATDGAGA
ncbi:class II D-tagatose-bisphosphate aldolase, non-catalytic subunit [Rappaport israeli]|uniref:class II D-tagatose-bisphosphate aldolase, non-catalytic subunit n=1 Tax=Rappaport israeli TaxID=1839807 RepID=UPI000930378E|nr:class II D-tagatose-bisphosphate aldolase, non-catalytic subunit [Rappaport israeli]